MKEKKDIFKHINCDRCGKILRCRCISMYNKDILCPSCKKAEMERPDFNKVREAVREAYRSGDENFIYEK